MMSRVAAEPGRPGSFPVALHLLATWPHALVRHWYRRAAIKALQELDDRALRDIGLMRCHIEAAVRSDLRRRGG